MKIAIITGTSRGLGLALAQEFTANGWQVVGTGRSDRPTELPKAAEYHQFDASDYRAAEDFWQQVYARYAESEVCLVNNAGGYVYGGLGETAPKDFASQMDSIYFSAVYMTRALTLNFDSARIINIISSSALAPAKNEAAYGAAKAAERHFFQSIQKELDASKYQVTNTYPSDIASQAPDPNLISVEDLAAFVRELADSEASYYLPDVTLRPSKRNS